LSVSPRIQSPGHLQPTEVGFVCVAANSIRRGFCVAANSIRRGFHEFHSPRPLK
jgi:hypothetical protein